MAFAVDCCIKEEKSYNLSRNQKGIKVCTKSNFWLCVSVSMYRVTLSIE